MYTMFKPYPFTYYVNAYGTYPYPCLANTQMYNSHATKQSHQNIPISGKATEGAGIELKDYGPEPFVADIEAVTRQNTNYRTALWTGSYLQLTLMSLMVGEDIGLEVHPTLDQFIRIEEGEGIVKMGDSENNLDFQRNVSDDFAFIIPAGKWHNLYNTGNKPLKLYSIYAPPQHPQGTVHETKAIAQAAEQHHSH